MRSHIVCIFVSGLSHSACFRGLVLHSFLCLNTIPPTPNFSHQNQLAEAHCHQPAIPALPGLTFPGFFFFFSWYEIVGGIILGHDSCALTNLGSGEVSAHRPRPAVPHQSRRELCVQPPHTSSAPRAGQGAAGEEAREVRVCWLLCPECFLPLPTRCLWGPHWSVGSRPKEAEAPEAESFAHCHQQVPIA